MAVKGLVFGCLDNAARERSKPSNGRSHISARNRWFVRGCLMTITWAGAFLGASATTQAAPSVFRQGVFTVVHDDSIPGSDRPDRTLYYLRTRDHAIRLHFAQSPSFRPGQTITVEGSSGAPESLSVQSAQVSGPLIPEPTTGTQSVLVMLVDWTAPDSVAPSQAVSQIGTLDNEWFEGTSYGRLGLTATATPWMTIPDSTQNGTTCNLYQILSDAEAAATAAGYDPASYLHEMVYIPAGTPGCNTAAGQGEVNGRVSWIYGYLNTRVTI